MPRKDRHPKTRIDTPLSPYMHHELMTGDSASPARLVGWVDYFQIPLADVDAVLAAAWSAHGDALLEEAAAFDFIPWGHRHQRPTGDGVERWQAAFIAKHQY